MAKLREVLNARKKEAELKARWPSSMRRGLTLQLDKSNSFTWTWMIPLVAISRKSRMVSWWTNLFTVEIQWGSRLWIRRGLSMMCSTKQLRIKIKRTTLLPPISLFFVVHEQYPLYFSIVIRTYTFVFPFYV